MDLNNLKYNENERDMKLNLDLPKNVFCKSFLNFLPPTGSQFFPLIIAADQTPTPTRLIRNCEAVGLFDDLNTVNPFEESFGRALENPGSIEGIISEANLLSVDSCLSQKEDTLHTPQPPQLAPRYYGKKPEPNQNSVRESVIVDKAKLTPEIKEIPPVKKLKSELPESSQQLILPKPAPCNRIVYVAPIPVQSQSPAHSQVPVKEEVGQTSENQNVKDKLKSIILNGKQEAIPTIIFGAVPTILATPATILNYSQKTTEEIIKVPTKKEINARKQSTVKSSAGNSDNNNNKNSSDESSKAQSPGSEKGGGGGMDKAQRNRAAAQRYR